MKEFIISEATKIFRNAIIRLAKEKGFEAERVFILLYQKTHPEVEAAYKLCYKGNAIEELTIKQILNIKLVDFRGFSVLVPPHVSAFLTDFKTELKSENIFVSVYLDEAEDSENIRLFLFKDNELVREVFLNDLIKDS